MKHHFELFWLIVFFGYKANDLKIEAFLKSASHTFFNIMEEKGKKNEK